MLEPCGTIAAILDDCFQPFWRFAERVMFGKGTCNVTSAMLEQIYSRPTKYSCKVAEKSMSSKPLTPMLDTFSQEDLYSSSLYHRPTSRSISVFPFHPAQTEY